MASRWAVGESGLKTLAGIGLFGAALVGLAPAAAQVVPLPPVIPGQVASTTAPTGVTSDPYRVFGDDAPVFAGLGVLGGLGFRISGSLITEYSDNIARVSGDDDVGGRYTSKDDWIFRPTVAVNMSRDLGRQTVFLSGSIGRQYFARNTMLNSNNLNVGGGASLSLGNRCGGNLKAGYSNRGTQLGTFEEVIPSEQERVSLGASATCRTPGGLSGSLSYGYSNATNHTHDPLNEVDRSFANVNSNHFGANIGYAVGARGQVGLQGSWSKNRYPNQLLPTGGSNRNEIVSGSVFAAYRVGSSLSASGSVGKSEVRTNVPGSSAFSGTTWNVSMNYSGPRIGAGISTGRSVSGGAGGSANYSIGTFFNTSVNYRLNDRMSVAGGIATSNSDYRGLEQLPETEAVRSSKSRRYFVGADYSMSKIFSFSLDLNHQKRSSDPSGYSYDENSILLGIRARF